MRSTKAILQTRSVVLSQKSLLLSEFDSSGLLVSRFYNDLSKVNITQQVIKRMFHVMSQTKNNRTSVWASRNASTRYAPQNTITHNSTDVRKIIWNYWKLTLNVEEIFSCYFWTLINWFSRAIENTTWKLKLKRIRRTGNVSTQPNAPQSSEIIWLLKTKQSTKIYKVVKLFDF